jgi:hypothetical protein
LQIFKKKKVIFKIVTSSPDIKIQLVTYSADYKVKFVDSQSSAVETIKVQFVSYSPDVKFQQVSSSPDFEAFLIS